jgi:hypothetical protein
VIPVSPSIIPFRPSLLLPRASLPVVILLFFPSLCTYSILCNWRHQWEAVFIAYSLIQSDDYAVGVSS